MRPMPYAPSLDGLRAVAILAVMAHHLGWVYGGVGVEMFFTLSGYLITGLLLTEYHATGRVALKAFFIRRAARLIPALAVVTAVWLGVLLVATRPSGATLAYTAAAVLTYTTNWLVVAGQPLDHFFGHTWSLAVEEQFLVLWPPVLWALLRARALWAVLGLAALASAWRVAAYARGTDLDVLFYRSDTRAESLLIGCVLALVLLRTDLTRVRTWLTRAAPVGLVVLGAVPLTVPRESPVWYLGLGLVVSVSTATVIAAACTPTSWVARLLAVPTLRGVGRVSYGLFLWHYPLFLAFQVWVPGALHPFTLGHGLVALALAGACAWTSSRWVERPCRDAGRRFTSRAPQHPTPVRLVAQEAAR